MKALRGTFVLLSHFSIRNVPSCCEQLSLELLSVPRSLWEYMLIMLTTGRALGRVQLAEPGNSLTAWKNWCENAHPEQRGRQTATR